MGEAGILPLNYSRLRHRSYNGDAQILSEEYCDFGQRKKEPAAGGGQTPELVTLIESYRIVIFSVNQERVGGNLATKGSAEGIQK